MYVIFLIVRKQSLSRWVQRYNNDKSIKRYNRKSISYKITKQHVEYSLKLLKKTYLSHFKI